MSRPEDIRNVRAVEQTRAAASSCCSGPAPDSSVRVAGRKPEEVIP